MMHEVSVFLDYFWLPIMYSAVALVLANEIWGDKIRSRIWLWRIMPKIRRQTEEVLAAGGLIREMHARGCPEDHDVTECTTEGALTAAKMFIDALHPRKGDDHVAS